MSTSLARAYGVWVPSRHTPLIAAVREHLASAGDAERADHMRAYMKSELPYRGVPVPEVRKICRRLFKDHPIAERDVWEATTRDLYDNAQVREERYAAICLTGDRMAKAWQDLDTIALYQHMIVVGAWWDLVDDVAIHRVGPILRATPDEVRRILLSWAEGDDMWLRRSAIISQVGAKDATDRELLMACIGPSIDSSEFFLRKAIGWALRDYAKTNPAWVQSYVATNDDRLSVLSRREALKNLT